MLKRPFEYSPPLVGLVRNELLLLNLVTSWVLEIIKEFSVSSERHISASSLFPLLVSALVGSRIDGTIIVVALAIFLDLFVSQSQDLLEVFLIVVPLFL